MTSAADMISTALIDARAFPPGETIPSADSAFALSRMNSMLDSWQTQRLMIYSIYQEHANLVSGTATYTMGTAGTFSSTRPIRIVKAFIRIPTNMDIQLEIFPFEAYDDIVLKSLQSDYPQYLFNDASYTTGTTTIKLWTVPQTVYPLYIDSWKQLQSFSSLSMDLALPPGYQLAIESNLTLRLAPSYGKTPSDDMRKIARDALANVRRFNAATNASVMAMPVGMPGLAGSRRSGSILTGP